MQRGITVKVKFFICFKTRGCYDSAKADSVFQSALTVMNVSHACGGSSAMIRRWGECASSLSIFMLWHTA